MSDAARPGLFRRLEQTVRRWRDDARGRVDAAAIRARARQDDRAGALGGGDAPTAPVHGLFLHHEANAAIDQHFHRLVAETQGLIVWHRLYNPGRGDRPQTDLAYQHPSLLMPRRYDAFARNRRGVQGGLADIAILPSVLATDAPFVWVMEYDVDFAGHWSAFFSRFSRDRTDFLSAELTFQNDSRHWFHWTTAHAPARVRRRRRLRSFNPLMRLSRRFALAYVQALRDADWRGHYEFTLPTIAVDGGFSVEDLGGDGRLCPPHRRNQNYTATSGQKTLSPGSFVWRPVIPGYYQDRPDLFPVGGLLYHPCKVDVPSWDAIDAGVISKRLPALKPHPSVAVVMATGHGAQSLADQSLADQLASLARQTRPPDELVIGADAATDATRAILTAFAAEAPFPVTIVERRADLGHAANIIDAADKTTADLILFCDQDDVWYPDKIEIIANAARTTEACLYTHDLEISHDRSDKGTGARASYFDHLRNMNLSPDLCFKAGCLAVRQDFLRRLGWPPPRSTMPLDVWISFLGTALGQRALIEAPLIRHRIHRPNTAQGLVSPTEKASRAKAPAEEPFAAMLDAYIGESNRAWISDLRQGLETTGAAIDPVRARAACDILHSRR